jgi:hypothetical protein
LSGETAAANAACFFFHLPGHGWCGNGRMDDDRPGGIVAGALCRCSAALVSDDCGAAMAHAADVAGTEHGGGRNNCTSNWLA